MPNQPSNDILFPKSLVLPNVKTSGGELPSMSGQIMISGATILFYDGAAVQILSGSNTGD